MLRKVLSVTLTLLLMQLSVVQPVAASTKAEKEAQFVGKVKDGIARLGTGIDARIKVNLRNNTKLKGYIGESNADYFVVVDEKSGAATTISYPQVKQVKGNNLSEGAKLAITVGVALGLAVLLAIAVGRGG